MECGFSLSRYLNMSRPSTLLTWQAHWTHWLELSGLRPMLVDVNRSLCRYTFPLWRQVLLEAAVDSPPPPPPALPPVGITSCPVDPVRVSMAGPFGSSGSQKKNDEIRLMKSF